MTEQFAETARALLNEVGRAHPICCTCCMRCRSCGHPCQQVRLSTALRQALKHAQ